MKPAMTAMSTTVMHVLATVWSRVVVTAPCSEARKNAMMQTSAIPTPASTVESTHAAAMASSISVLKTAMMPTKRTTTLAAIIAPRPAAVTVSRATTYRPARWVLRPVMMVTAAIPMPAATVAWRRVVAMAFSAPI